MLFKQKRGQASLDCKCRGKTVVNKSIVCDNTVAFITASTEDVVVEVLVPEVQIDHDANAMHDTNDVYIAINNSDNEDTAQDANKEVEVNLLHHFTDNSGRGAEQAWNSPDVPETMQSKFGLSQSKI